MPGADFRGKTFVELKMKKAGDGIINSTTAMRYVSGCISRERSRVAEAIKLEGTRMSKASDSAEYVKSLLRLAQAIEQPSLDDDRAVFQWRPAATTFKMGVDPVVDIYSIEPSDVS